MFTSAIEYKEGDDIFEGFVATENKNEKRPAVIVGHIWGGLDEFAKNKAKLCAERGYVGFALDAYGKGKRAVGETEPEKCEALMQLLLDDRKLLRRRMLATLETVKNLPYVDENNVVIIGYCLGGMCAVDLARAGADIKAVVSFHGLLNKPDTLSTQEIKAKVLVLHADIDPFVTPEDLIVFEKEMTDAHADWQVLTFGNTEHGFTNPKLTKEPMNAYSPVATHMGEMLMWDLFERVFT